MTKTIGINPLLQYLGDKDLKPASPIEPEILPAVKKQRVTIHIPIDLIERVKNAVFWQPGLTLAEFAEQALAHAIEELENERGTPFPPRKKPLRGGRPMK